MDGFLDRMERRFGRFAVHDLTKKLVILKSIIFILCLILYKGDMSQYAETLGKLGHGNQNILGDLIACLCTPPSESIIWLIFALWIFLLCGRSIESSWGTFRFNLFVLLYIFIYMGILISVRLIYTGVPIFDNSFLYASLFLTFATLFPNYEFHIYFILPVKVKFLAWIYGLFMLWTIISQPHPVGKLIFAIPLIHYGVYIIPYLIKRNHHTRRRVAFEKKVDPVKRNGFFHECAVCGLTDHDDPDMLFRVGDDGKDYCEKHLD